jgi:DNA-binding transcriptional LysR family regulator
VGTNPIWHFLKDGVPGDFKPTSRFRCNSGTAVVDAAIAGMGICQLPRFYVSDAIMRKELVPILRPFRGAPEPIWLVYPSRRHLQPKVRHLVTMLSEKLQPELDAAGNADA